MLIPSLQALRWNPPQRQVPSPQSEHGKEGPAHTDARSKREEEADHVAASTGNKFDSSRDRNSPFVTQIGSSRNPADRPHSVCLLISGLECRCRTCHPRMG